MYDDKLRKKILNVEEVAGYLSVSVNTIRAWIKRRCVPFIKINGSIRFDIEGIDKWIQRNKQDDINECGVLNNGSIQENRQRRSNCLRH